MKKIFDKKKKAGGYKDGEKNEGGWKRDESRGQRPTLYRATCDKCHAACEVPFQPTGQRPVYCRDCFRTTESGSSFERPAQRPSFFDKKPSFNSAPRPSSNNNDEVVKQLKALNTKMDQLLEALSGFEVAVDGDEEEEDGNEDS